MKLHCDIQLPASKSESNRALMIAAYGGFEPDFQSLSDSNDTLVLANALRKIQQNEVVIDIADCGTAARFLTTFLASREGNWVLTGTERMKQRPIAPLVEALRGLNADIQYVEKKSFLPLHIKGNSLRGGKVQLDTTQSSQFASSLLLAAPTWSQGIELELVGRKSSVPYLDMTLAMMRHFGAVFEQNNNTVFVAPNPYQSRDFVIEADWSAASYWYEMAALSEECEIRLNGHFDRLNGLQGDAVIADWMESFGVNTEMIKNALILTKKHFEKLNPCFDFSNNPDLFPTMAATCAGKQLKARFSGIANLRIKESDRVEAMKTELGKMGTVLEYISDNELIINPSSKHPFFEETNPLQFASHDDHRIVMALAPLAMRVGNVVFDRPDVVGKSYPGFWHDAPFLLFQR